MPPLLAVIVIGYAPPVSGSGVPLNVAVPFPLSRNVTPSGKLPVSVTAGTGKPTVVTENQPGDPTVNVVMLPEVMARPWFTFNVKLWVELVPTPFAAMIVIG